MRKRMHPARRQRPGGHRVAVFSPDEFPKPRNAYEEEIQKNRMNIRLWCMEVEKKLDTPEKIADFRKQMWLSFPMHPDGMFMTREEAEEYEAFTGRKWKRAGED